LSKQSRFGIVYAAHIDADVSDAAFRLFVRLSSYADKDGYCFPGVALLSEQSGVQPRQIRKLLAELVQAGLIIREEQYRKDGSQCASVTRIPVPVEQAGVSSQDRGDWATMTVLEQTIRTDHSTDHLTNIDPCGDEEKLEEHMPVFGSLDDDVEMPENGKPVKPVKKFESAPKAGTHSWLIYRFGQEQHNHNCGRGFTVGILHRAFKDLRDDGFTNEEIEVMIRVFFARNEHDIRAKMADIDVAVMFRTRMNSLKTASADVIRSEKTGGAEKSKAISQGLRERMRQRSMQEKAARNG
jgi:hypothetical protein